MITRVGHKTLSSALIENEEKDSGVKSPVRFSHDEEGDGVTKKSSTVFKDKLLTLELDNAFFYWDHVHALMMNDLRVQTLTKRFLSDKPFSHTMIGGNVSKL